MLELMNIKQQDFLIKKETEGLTPEEQEESDIIDRIIELEEKKIREGLSKEEEIDLETLYDIFN